MSDPLLCGRVIGDAFLVQSGVLGINVWVDRDREVRTLHIPDTAAARCVEDEDGLCWTVKGPVLWSNRARTVRDVELGRADVRKGEAK